MATLAPLRIAGPSSGNGAYDDGGDYALIDESNDIVFEAFFRVKNAKYAPAEENARRLAAMWQACEGIPTDALESGALQALLEACRALVENARWYTGKVWYCHHCLATEPGDGDGTGIVHAGDCPVSLAMVALAPFEREKETT